MAFVLKKSSTYKWPVRFDMPIDGGKYEKLTFDAEFKRIPDSRVKAILNDESSTDLAFCAEILVGWAGVQDDTGADLPFSQSALTEVLEVPGLASVIVKTYLESIVPAKAKN